MGQDYLKKSKTFVSSYQKTLLSQNIYVNKLGLENDTQCDKDSHGGLDKAVCVYPHTFYNYFLNEHKIELPPCAFGENLSILDIQDKDICLGDRYQNGNLIFEVSQPRQPCWKVSTILGIKKLTALMVTQAKTGFYLRVIQEGILDKSKGLTLISRVHEDISIEFINKASYSAKNSQKAIKKILACKELSMAYKDDLEKRLMHQQVGLEDWQDDQYFLNA